MAGSIIKRGDNTYRLQVCIGTDYTGKPNRFSKTVHVDNKKAAEKELANFYKECELQLLLKDPSCTFANFIKIWWSEYVELYTKISTQRGYKTAIKIHIYPAFGKQKLVELTALKIQKWVNDMKADNLSSKSIKNYFSVLNDMLSYAVKWDYLNDNPCKKVMLPKATKKESKYYNSEELTALLEALKTVPYEDLVYKVAIYIIVFGGLRKGEVFGINEDDVSMQNNTIRVVRTRMIAEKVGVYEDTPKTETSVRIVSMPKPVMDMIAELIVQQSKRKQFWANKWQNSPALLKGIHGGAMYPQMLQRWFTRFLKENNLPHIGLHGLRHTHTSLLMSMTDDMVQVSKRLGHSELSTTLNIYTHMFENSDQKIIESMTEKYFD